MALEKEKAFGNAEQEILPVIDKDGIKTMSINYLIDSEDTPVIWRGPIVGNAVKQFWTDVVWGELDVLFIDMPPGTGDVALTIMQSLPVNGVIMVSTPQPMVSMIVTKAIKMLKQMDIPVLGVIENMAYINCPDCGKKINIYSENDTEKFIADNDIELLGELPMVPAISNIRLDEELSADDQKLIQDLIMPIVTKLVHVLN